MPYESFPAFSSCPSSPPLSPTHSNSTFLSSPLASRPESRRHYRPATKRPRPSSPATSTSSRSNSTSLTSPRSDPRKLLRRDLNVSSKGLSSVATTTVVAPGRRGWTDNSTLNIFLQNRDGYFDDSDSSADEDEDEPVRLLPRSRLNPLRLFSRKQVLAPIAKKQKPDEFGSHFYL